MKKISKNAELNEDEKTLCELMQAVKHIDIEKEHSLQVARLALSLYDQIQDIHLLTPHDRKILLVGAFLHDIGISIEFKKHHKHSFDIINLLDIKMIKPKEKILAAHVARYHRKAEPKTKHKDFAILSDEEKRTVEKLAAILRIADGLDRSHKQLIKKVNVHMDENYIYLDLITAGDIYSEKLIMEKKSHLFKRIFNLEIKIMDKQV